MNLMTGDPLDLSKIRSTLMRVEDTIIFALIERAQFAHNPRLYDRGGFADVLHDDKFHGSWLEWMLRETEAMHAKIRRYESPDEHPFTSRHDLPQCILPPLPYPQILHDPAGINVNARILDFYIRDIVPSITEAVTAELKAKAGREDDDGNYGSSGTRDVECLQAISRRVHYGMFVSESKFREHPADFVPHILTPNPRALEQLITKPAVEEALLRRLERKALWYGRELDASGEPGPSPDKTRIEIDQVVRLYRDYIIPLTKDVEVEYLLHRLDGLSEEEVSRLASTA